MRENTASVLIVDDEADACANLRDILTDLGYRADTASNGQEAIEFVGRLAYDVTLLDLKMPGMDGVTAYRKIKRLCPETVAIVVSAFSGSELAETAIQEGASRVIAKPVDVPQLLDAIVSSLAQPLVLVVDDDPDFCENIWQLLKERAYRPAIARSIEEARRQLAAKSFDVVLIDLKLSATDSGEEVFRFVQETNPKARRIIITGFPEEMLGAIRQLVDQGADAIIYKPLDFDSLLGLLNR
jgi:DNA-binding NtrC family response regulator